LNAQLAFRFQRSLTKKESVVMSSFAPRVAI